MWDPRTDIATSSQELGLLLPEEHTWRTGVLYYELMKNMKSEKANLVSLEFSGS